MSQVSFVSFWNRRLSVFLLLFLYYEDTLTCREPSVDPCLQSDKSYIDIQTAIDETLELVLPLLSSTQLFPVGESQGNEGNIGQTAVEVKRAGEGAGAGICIGAGVVECAGREEAVFASEGV